jgi:hypothetical protein
VKRGLAFHTESNAPATDDRTSTPARMTKLCLRPKEFRLVPKINMPLSSMTYRSWSCPCAACRTSSGTFVLLGKRRHIPTEGARLVYVGRQETNLRSLLALRQVIQRAAVYVRIADPDDAGLCAEDVLGLSDVAQSLLRVNEGDRILGRAQFVNARLHDLV